MPLELLADDKLPVIIHPTSLTFHSDDTSSHHQQLTLYNPYDFTLRYKVLSTARDKYKVVDSEGFLKSRCSTDIIFMYRDVCSSNEKVHDKFRIQIMEQGKKSILGKKDFMSVLLPTAPKPNPQLLQPDEDFLALHPLSSSQELSFENKRSFVHHHPAAATPSSPPWWVVVTALVCVGVLMVPLDTDPHSLLPPYLRVTVHQKYICAYILGLVTMKLIQSS